jgi:hypothetical protein
LKANPYLFKTGHLMRVSRSIPTCTPDPCNQPTDTGPPSSSSSSSSSLFCRWVGAHTGCVRVCGEMMQERGWKREMGGGSNF